MKVLDKKSMNSVKGGSIYGRVGRWFLRVIRDGLVYDGAKAIAGSYEYDPEVNYTPWYGPGGGGFK